jgi:hypothetical protein
VKKRRTGVAEGCPGPLIWYETTMKCICPNEHPAAILHCTACGYIVCSGGFNDEAHADTEIMREGLAQ